MELNTFGNRFLAVCIFFCGPTLVAQEISFDNAELDGKPMPFLEFVGWMERSDDLWITPFDLREGFSIEDEIISVNTESASPSIIVPDESVDP